MTKKLPEALLATRPALADDPYGEHPSNGPLLGPIPARYSKAVHDSIIASIKQFQRPVVAAQIAGIPASLYYRWMQMGKEGNPHLYEFVQDVEQAIAVAEGKAIDSIVLAAKTDPENYKWYLTARHPEAYSKEVAARVNGELENFFRRLEAGLDAPTFEKVLAIFAGQALPGVAALTAHDPEEE